MCLLCVSCVRTNSSVSCLSGCSACVSSISSDIPLSPASPSYIQREGGIEGRERETLCVCVNVCVLVVCAQTARYLVYLVARPVSHRYHPIVRCLPRHPPTYRESEGGRMHKHSTTLQGCPKMWTLRGARSQIKTMLTYACTHTHTHTNTHTDIYVYLFVCACVCVCVCVCAAPELCV